MITLTRKLETTHVCKTNMSSDNLTFKEFEMLLFTEDVATQFLSGPRWPASVPELSRALGAELDRGPVLGDCASQQWRVIEQVQGMGSPQTKTIEIILKGCVFIWLSVVFYLKLEWYGVKIIVFCTKSVGCEKRKQ